MIKFFRTIRQRMLQENRISRYFLYAIGEIVLVVIGILIALQINTWNEQRKVLAQEQKYLAALKDEFEYNKAQVDKVMSSNARFAEAANEILEHTGPEEPVLSEKEFITLFKRMVNSEVQYRPSNGVLQEIISSGKLGIFRDPELRKLLSSWDGILYTVKFQEGELNYCRMELIDMLNEKGNVRTLFMDSSKSRTSLAPSGFATENREMLRSEVFENRTTAFLATSRYSNSSYYSKVEKTIAEILVLIEKGSNP